MDSSLTTWPMFNSLANKMGNTNPVGKTDTKDRKIINKVLSHKHMIETIERFEWKNLPSTLPTDLIERILYFRFKGAFFKFNERYVFLPFTLKGTIDSYGRYNDITPVLFTGQWKMGGDGKFEEDISFVTGKSYKPIYDLPEKNITDDPEEEEYDALKHIDSIIGIPDCEKFAVILTDSSLEVSQDFTPMEYLIRPFVEQLTDILVLVNTDLISSAKTFYVVAKDADQKVSIEQEFANLDNRILNGKRIVVVTSPTKLEELTGSSAKDSARYFQSYQSIDNLRKDIIGGDNGGTFMKQEHTTEIETETNSNSSGGSAVMNNALRMRQDFCEIVNSIFGLDVQVDIKGAGDQSLIAPEGEQTKDRRGDEE